MRSLPPLPSPDELTKPYWEAARQGYLVVQRCQSCLLYHHPPLPACPSCVTSELMFERVSGKGRIYSYTIMRDQRVQGFEGRIPYINLLVELDEQPHLIVITNLIGDEDRLEIGARVEVTFEKLTDEVVLPQFRLVEGLG